MRAIAILSLATLCVCSAACTPRYSGSTYTQDQMGRAATVMKGTVLAIRPVAIAGSQSGIGATAGAAGGAVAGSAIGGGTRSNIAGAIGGAVIGGVAGAVAEEAATRSGALEFIIRQENGQTIAVVQTNEETLAEGDAVLILRSDKVRLIRDKLPK